MEVQTNDQKTSIRKYLINEGRSEQTAHIVATAMRNKCADNDKMTVKDIKRVRDIFLQQEDLYMKQVIYATTSSEAMTLAFALSKYYAVLVASNEYDSDKDFEGVVIYDKNQTIYKNI